MDERKTKSILWVDDDFKGVSLRSECSELEGYGYNIVKTFDADEFFNALDKNKDYACLIIDIALPLTDMVKDDEDVMRGLWAGYVILKKIFSEEKYKEIRTIPIIVYTITSSHKLYKFCEEHDILYIRKIDVLPNQFATEVNKFIS